MRPSRILLLPIFIGSLFLPIAAQQPSSSAQVPQRDSQATTFLLAAVRAMGGKAPQGFIAHGTIMLVEGSLTTSGTIRILARDTGQTSEQVQTNAKSWTLVYSYGEASRTEQKTTKLSLERAATSQSVHIPLFFLLGLLSNPDFSIQYIGPETLGGSAVRHIRATNTFNASPSFQFLSPFTVREIWLDASTNLPAMVSFDRRDGGGATPKILVTVAYSKFETTNGLTYPQQIQESINGTVWETITLQSVTLNTGLTDSDFVVEEGAN
jgi:hypothetical protein